jgi:hypothetical protein
LYLICESDYNMILRNSYAIYKFLDYSASQDYIGVTAIKETAGAWENPNGDILTQDKDLYEYNDVYNRKADVKEFITAPLVDATSNDSDVKITASLQKTMNESVDSWSRFLFANTLELDSQYGPITKLERVSGDLVAFQEDAVAYLSIAEREQIVGSSGFELAIGSGGILERYDYINTDVGLSNYYGTVPTPTGLYFFDSKLFTFNMLSKKAEPSIEKIKGMDSYFKTQRNNTNFSFHSLGYDRKFNEIYINLEESTSTPRSIIYNDLHQAFTGVYEFSDTTSGIFLTHIISNHDITYAVYTRTDNDLVFATLNNQDSDLGIEDVTLTLILNPYQGEVARFDSLEWNSVVQRGSDYSFLEDNDDTFSSLQLLNEYQNTGAVASSNFKRRFRSWRCNNLRDNATNDPRIRGGYGKLILNYTQPTSLYRINLDSLKLYYQPNKR